MAEFIGLIGLGLAAPGIISVTVNAATALHDRISLIRKSNAAIEELKEVAIGMSKGSIRSSLAIVHNVARDPTADKATVAMFEDLFRAVVKKLSEIVNMLNEEIDEKSNKLKFSFSGHARLKAAVASLKLTQKAFVDATILESSRQNARPAHELDSNALRIEHETSSNIPGRQLPRSRIQVCRASFREPGTGSLQEGEVIVEKKETRLPNDLSEIKVLASKFGNRPSTAFLPFLGFRPHARLRHGCDLVFQLPSSESGQSILQILQTMPTLSFDTRVSIARKLASAVLGAHAAGLVHKSIRPSNVLLLWNGSLTTNHARSTLFLTDWSLARSNVDSLNYKTGSRDWPITMYQHPQRHGEFVEYAYTIVHDIYSVGVCLLEIFLGQALVQYDVPFENPVLNPLFRSRAALQASKRGVPDAENADTAAMMEDAATVKQILLNIAREELPRLVPDRFVSLVEDCLEGFHGGFDQEVTGDRSRSEGNVSPEQKIEDGLKYIQKVVMALD